MVAAPAATSVQGCRNAARPAAPQGETRSRRAIQAGGLRRRIGRPRKPPAWMARLDRVSPWGAAGLAAFLQPWTLVAAGAATITEAKLATAGSYLALILFCLLASSSFLYLELYATFAPARASARLDQLRAWLGSHQDQVLIAVFLLLGFWLAGKSIYLLVN